MKKRLLLDIPTRVLAVLLIVLLIEGSTRVLCYTGAC